MIASLYPRRWYTSPGNRVGLDLLVMSISRESMVAMRSKCDGCDVYIFGGEKGSLFWWDKTS